VASIGPTNTGDYRVVVISAGGVTNSNLAKMKYLLSPESRWLAEAGG